MMSQKRFIQAKAELLAGQARQATARTSRIPVRIMGLLLVVLLAGDSAFADFLVQPMILRLTVQAGKTYTRQMKLENSDPKEPETVTLRLAELTQKTDASWTEFRPDDPNFSKANLRSCMGWCTVPSNEFKIAGYQTLPFDLRVEVPPQAKGFYFAAIVATTAPRILTLPTGQLAPVSMQLVIPLIVEVQGTPVQRDISLTGVDLQYQAQTLKDPARNNVFVDIANPGGTFSSLLPIVRLWNQVGGHWQQCAEVKFPALSIMPGAKLHVAADAGLALPSGQYQAEAYLFVDGRRGDVIKRTITFKSGDPTLIPRSGEPSLRVQPAELFLDVIPGATRTTPVQIMNGSDEEIKVKPELIVPEHMQSMTTGNGIRGDDLSCAGWVTLSPAEFTLKGHGQRSVTVLAKLPKDAVKYRNYYGTLRLRVSFADGKPAGTKDSLVCVRSTKGTEKSVLIDGTVLTIAELSPSRYQAAATFSNKGANHVTELNCLGYLSKIGATAGTGASVLKRFLMTNETPGQTGLLLPIDARSFSGVLDVSDVPIDTYYLTAILTYPESPAEGAQKTDTAKKAAGTPKPTTIDVQKSITIEVYEEGGARKARMKDVTGVTQKIRL